MKLISCEVTIRHGLQDEAHFCGKRFKEFISRFPSVIVQKGGEKVNMLKVKQERKRPQETTVVCLLVS